MDCYCALNEPQVTSTIPELFMGNHRIAKVMTIFLFLYRLQKPKATHSALSKLTTMNPVHWYWCGCCTASTIIKSLTPKILIYQLVVGKWNDCKANPIRYSIDVLL